MNVNEALNTFYTDLQILKYKERTNTLNDMEKVALQYKRNARNAFYGAGGAAMLGFICMEFNPKLAVFFTIFAAALGILGHDYAVISYNCTHPNLDSLMAGAKATIGSDRLSLKERVIEVTQHSLIHNTILFGKLIMPKMEDKK